MSPSTNVPKTPCPQTLCPHTPRPLHSVSPHPDVPTLYSPYPGPLPAEGVPDADDEGGRAPALHAGSWVAAGTRGSLGTPVANTRRGRYPARGAEIQVPGAAPGVYWGEPGTVQGVPQVAPGDTGDSTGVASQVATGGGSGGNTRDSTRGYQRDNGDRTTRQLTGSTAGTGGKPKLVPGGYRCGSREGLPRAALEGVGREPRTAPGAALGAPPAPGSVSYLWPWPRRRAGPGPAPHPPSSAASHMAAALGSALGSAPLPMVTRRHASLRHSRPSRGRRRHVPEPAGGGGAAAPGPGRVPAAATSRRPRRRGAGGAVQLPHLPGGFPPRRRHRRLRTHVSRGTGAAGTPGLARPPRTDPPRALGSGPSLAPGPLRARCPVTSAVTGTPSPPCQPGTATPSPVLGFPRPVPGPLSHPGPVPGLPAWYWDPQPSTGTPKPGTRTPVPPCQPSTETLSKVLAPPAWYRDTCPTLSARYRDPPPSTRTLIPHCQPSTRTPSLVLGPPARYRDLGPTLPVWYQDPVFFPIPLAQY